MKSIKVSFNTNLNYSENYTLKIDNYQWSDNNYNPEVLVYLCHNNEKLKIKFVSFESEITFKEKKDNGRVWCDSCVEFFLQPFKDDLRYINFEINPLGTMIMSIGENKNNRISLIKKHKDNLNVRTAIEEDYWIAEFEIPFLMLYEIFNKSSNTIIKEMSCNFHKCGDETKHPHFGVWNVISSKKPNFHLSEYFGKLICKRQIRV